MVKKEASGFMEHLKRFRYFYLIIIVLIITGSFIFYLYSSLEFKQGDVIFSKGSSKIGQIGAVNFFKSSYIVSWSDGTLTEEKGSNIAKINNLDLTKLNSSLPLQNNSVDSSFSNPSEYDKTKDYNFSDYVFEKSTGNEKIIGIVYKGFSNVSLLSSAGCIPNMICADWGECKLDYDLSKLLSGSSFLGIQYKTCKDSHNCLPNLIDSRACKYSENITVTKKLICGKEQLELKNDAGNVVAILDSQSKNNYADVQINLFNYNGC